MSGSLGYRPTVQLSQPNTLFNVAVMGQGQADELNLQRNRLAFESAQRADSADQAFRAAAPGAISGDAGAMNDAIAANPERALTLQQHMASLDANKRQAAAQNATYIGQAAAGLLTLPEDQAAAQYPTVLASLKARGLDVSSFPAAYPGRAAIEAAARSVDSVHNSLRLYESQPVVQGGGADLSRWHQPVSEAAGRHGVPVSLAMGVLAAESGGNPAAVSPKGATGLMQLMPDTARGLGVDARDPTQNIDGGVRYLGTMLQRYGGNQALALAAYNWGPGNVDRWMQRGGKAEELPAETRAYIQRVMFSGAPQTLVARGSGMPVTQGAAPGKAWARGPDGQMSQVPIPGAGDPVKAPDGFRMNPDGSMAPIAGGPADPKYIGEKAAAQSDGKGGNPLPDSTRKRLGELGERISSVTRLTDTFKPEFSASASIVGDLQNLVGRTTGKIWGEQAQWWQDYNSYANEIRNQLFGAALTKTEQAAFDRANITPGMAPDQIKANLARQAQIVKSGTERLAAGLVIDKFNPEAVSATLGVPVTDIMRRVDEVRASRLSGVAAPAGGGQPAAAPAGGGPEVTATNPQTGERIVLRNGQWVPMQ